jgi:hypothetical protein
VRVNKASPPTPAGRRRNALPSSTDRFQLNEPSLVVATVDITTARTVAEYRQKPTTADAAAADADELTEKLRNSGFFLWTSFMDDP